MLFLVLFFTKYIDSFIYTSNWFFYLCFLFSVWNIFESAVDENSTVEAKGETENKTKNETEKKNTTGAVDVNITVEAKGDHCGY